LFSIFWDNIKLRGYVSSGVLSRFTGTATTSYMIRFQFDQRVFTRTTLSRILWLQGAPKQAARMAESNVAEALALDHYNFAHFRVG